MKRKRFSKEEILKAWRNMDPATNFPGPDGTRPVQTQTIRLTRDFWGHKAGTRGVMREDRQGRRYIKLKGSPRAYVFAKDKGTLYEEIS